MTLLIIICEENYFDTKEEAQLVIDKEEINMDKVKEFFNSNNYLGEEDYYYIVDDLDYLLEENTKKVRGEVIGWAFLSHRVSRYGSICNHGQTGFKKIIGDNLAQAILLTDTDNIVARNNEGELEIIYSDHDGSHVCKIKPVTKSRWDRFERVINQDFDRAIEFIKDLPSVKIK